MDDSGALHVVIGAGPLGLGVATELQSRGAKVRLVSRSGRASSEGAEIVAADAADPSAAVRVCHGAAVVYHCAQPPYARWPREAPPLMRGIIEGAAAAGAKLIYGDNLYMYGKAPTPLVETLPDRPVGANGRTRARLAADLWSAHDQQRLRAAIARASDFYGPGATDSTMGARVFARALQGKPAQVLGDPDTAHSYTFIRDFAKALVMLGEHDHALGQVWHVPSGEARATRAFVELVYLEAGREPALSAAPSWFIRAAGVVNPTLRAVSEVLYQSERPWVLDASKFTDAFGDIATPHQEAIRTTLEWYSSTSS